MTFHELNQSYFAWMCQLVSNERYDATSPYGFTVRTVTCTS